MKRPFALALFAAVAALGALAYVNRGAISLAIVTKVASATLSNDTIAQLPDALSAGFCGTGSPLPDLTRSGPCTAIVAGKRLFVVDAGRGATEVLGRMGLQQGRIEAVLLTHFHSDHIDGLGQLAEQRWVGAAWTSPLPVYGPAGVERVVNGFNEAYAENGGYRTAHHGPDVAPASGYGMIARPFAIDAGPAGETVVLSSDGLTITAFTVDHGPVRPAVGYRFDYKGRSIVVSGDTAKCANLVRVSAKADLLIHEALSPSLVAMLEAASRKSGRVTTMHIMHDIPTYHTAPWDAADEASAAHVHALAFTHIIPPLPIPGMEGPFLGDAAARFSGEMFIARDGDFVTLPAAGGDMQRRRLIR